MLSGLRTGTRSFEEMNSNLARAYHFDEKET